MRKKCLILLSILVIVSTQSFSHEAEVTRESICNTEGTDIHFLRVFGADFGTPEIADRYVKVWREKEGVNLFTIDDPLDQGGLNSGICNCPPTEPIRLTCD